jgi:hypothetical protein
MGKLNPRQQRIVEEGERERGKATPSGDPREVAAKQADWPAQSGSRSGEFTFILANQVCRALVEAEDPRLRAVQHEAALAALEEIGPRDPIEGMLAAQIVAAYDAAMMCLHLMAHEQRLGVRETSLSQANKLMRSCAALVEALDRHRGKGRQVVRVEHVHVYPGGQAIVGAVGQPGGGGDGRGTEERAHAPAALAPASGTPLRCPDPERAPVPLAGGEG